MVPYQVVLATVFGAEIDWSEVLSDNMLIEKHLGDLGVICTEDLAHASRLQSEAAEPDRRRVSSPGHPHWRQRL